MIMIKLTVIIMLIAAYAVGVVCGIMLKTIKDRHDGKGSL